ncbi:3-methyl-2-oxobutanoate hydroxymethyltransferase [Kineosporia sp. J2-2]|uniref:3-methyl-2-oxobutanoate hydroxymethyltransferase n=1 Tax=Kineosporia corallincola TaxID=2835133 RepID=A0ABS5TIR3_9ACTN|nr:3-methyl-2-oxobutanoate hydroxymethyltransferase [Kineosporia corallincola]MBT0770961.1 3-methyl-2-oxobutanoate hydroxymethyltransferase [Kineosporia corallincola]
MSQQEEAAPYGGTPVTTDQAPVRKIRIHHLQQMKARGERWAMLTAYDQLSASVFDAAGIPVLLVGDSAANNVLGYRTTLPISLDEMIPLTRAVSGAAPHALVVADLPFGSYQGSPQQAFDSAVRIMKEGGAHAVKLEGRAALAPTVKLLAEAGIPVMAHIGFTPQSEHALGGYRVQGRGENAEQLLEDALALQAAGAFSVLMEMVPAPAAAAVTKALDVPTVGIGAGPDCDAQVLVWTDMAGFTGGKTARFVKKYADLRGILTEAAQEYARDVRHGTFPAPEHSFED